MITKEIAPYKKPLWSYQNGYGSAPQRVFPPFTQSNNNVVIPSNAGAGRSIIVRGKGPNEMTKMEFDMYVGALKQKVGDFLASKFTTKPYEARSVYKLVYINEMHKFVDSWATPEVGPIIFSLQALNTSALPFKAGANMWNTVMPEDLPEEWRKREGEAS